MEGIKRKIEGVEGEKGKRSVAVAGPGDSRGAAVMNPGDLWVESVQV